MVLPVRKLLYIMVNGHKKIGERKDASFFLVYRPEYQRRPTSMIILSEYELVENQAQCKADHLLLVIFSELLLPPPGLFANIASQKTQPPGH